MLLTWFFMAATLGWAGDKTPAKAWKSDMKLADDAFAKNQFSQATQLYQSAVTDATAAFPTNDARLSDTLRKLAVSSENTGDLTAAEVAQRRALAIDESRLGTNDVRLARDLVGLADKCMYQERYDEADYYFARAETLLELKFGPYEQMGGYCKVNRARVALMDNRYADAERLFKEAMECLESDRMVFQPQINGNPAQGVASTRKSLLAYALSEEGLLFMAEKKWPEAEAAFTQALQDNEYEFGKKSLRLPTILFNQAGAFSRENKLDQAEKALRRALDIMKNVDLDNPQVVKTRDFLAAVQRAETNASSKADH